MRLFASFVSEQLRILESAVFRQIRDSRKLKDASAEARARLSNPLFTLAPR